MNHDSVRAALETLAALAFVAVMCLLTWLLARALGVNFGS